jgi:GAF domain-containing protein
MSEVRHPEESRRVMLLHDLGVLDTPTDPHLTALVGLAAKICETPVAFINLIDDDRQCLISSVGELPEELPRDPSICNWAILEDEILEVPDAQADPRYRDAVQMVGEGKLRFYAGVSLKVREGLPIGTFCVMDKEPRCLTKLQSETLQTFANQAMAILESQREMRRLQRGLAVERDFDAASLAMSDFLGVITDRLPVRVA